MIYDRPTPTAQLPLKLYPVDPKSINYSFMIELLKGEDGLDVNDWKTAAVLLQKIGLPASDSNRRSLRAVAEASEGQICGGQHGYKLTLAMTAEEFQHHRNWMLSQAAKMQARIVQADKIFYSRQPVPA